MSDDSGPIPTPTAPRRRRTRTLAEAKSLVARWRASGLTQQAFCESEQILRSTLDSCRRRTGDRVPNKSAGLNSPSSGFVQVVGPDDVGSGSSSGLVVQTADGVRLEVTASWQLGLVGPMLAAIREVGR